MVMGMGEGSISDANVVLGSELSQPRPPPFRVWARPATHTASQPRPNYWTRNLPRKRLLT